MTVRATGDTHLPAELSGVDVRPGDMANNVRLIATRGASGFFISVMDTPWIRSLVYSRAWR